MVYTQYPPLEEEPINNFEVAHLADLVFVWNYLSQFEPEYATQPLPIIEEIKAVVARHSVKVEPHRARDKSGWERLPFDDDQALPGCHYFVDLHAARALAIVNDCAVSNKPPNTSTARRFCIEQFFYLQRDIVHKEDAFQEAFAGLLYALYDPQADVEVCLAMIEALAAEQQHNGIWSATHPIERRGGQLWYISSHEIALCLTWFYFLPNIPDKGRKRLLAMMERYFTQWVVPTHLERVQVTNGKSLFDGWYDDHHIQERFVSGWSTAIVCHFLTNYYWVLCNHLNATVIESLGLHDSSTNYSIDETTPAFSPRWKRDKGVVWFDLPPFSWKKVSRKDGSAELEQDLIGEWTDPKLGNEISRSLVRHVIQPIIDGPSRLPVRSQSSLILDGPPGTRKTSLVKQVARILEWPMVTVPASVILAQGFDQMHSSASHVFRRLKYLTGCVIFFDEFEEFFLRREGETPEPAQNGTRHVVLNVDNRTVAAFITSSMLPPLQDLHDEARCLIFLATNFKSKVDEAVLRKGRFDFNVYIPHPNCERALEYIANPNRRIANELGGKLTSEVKEIVTRALLNWKRKSRENGDRGVPFQIIEDALRQAVKTNRIDEQWLDDRLNEGLAAPDLTALK